MRKPSSNLKLMLFISLSLAVVFFSACTQQNNGQSPDKDAVADAQTIKAFTEFAGKDKGPVETKKYLDSLIAEAGTKTADKLVSEYIDYLDVEIASGLAGFEDDPALYGTGIKFLELEGSREPIIDYHFIDSYSGRISEEMNDYAAFMSLDSDSRWASDAELSITLEELGDRVAKAETFLTKYPAAEREEDVLTKYRVYLGAFLGGIDNTPLVDYGTGKIKGEFIAAYEYFINNYSGLKTAETVSRFKDELEAEGFAAPYGYSDYEKQSAFRKHVDETVQAAVDKL
jgi:hypothetical protein